MKKYLFFVFVIIGNIFAQDVIDISVKGISNDVKDGAQKDRMEAIMDAKRQACEKAGIQLKSQTTVENFQTVYDKIESEAETVLLPGFKIVEIGYTKDGTYQVVLSGKIKVFKEEEQISNKELRYAKSLNERGKYTECKNILKKYIDSDDEKVAESLKEEALYYYIKWGFSFDQVEDCEKFLAYYPKSTRVNIIKAFADYAGNNPIVNFKKEYQTDETKWIEKESEFESNKYIRQIDLVNENVIFRDFTYKEYTLQIQFSLFDSGESDNKNSLAYIFKVSYVDGNINNLSPSDLIEKLVVLDERHKAFYKREPGTFNHGMSNLWFKNFKLWRLNVKGNLPVGSDPYKYEIRFEVEQKGF